jgi:hypothetical protein
VRIRESLRASAITRADGVRVALEKRMSVLVSEVCSNDRVSHEIDWQRTQRRRHYHRNSQMKAHKSGDSRLRRKVIWD